MKITATYNYDSIGMIAGILCAIHCIATPFLFVAKACSAVCCADAPLWWKAIDYIFLVISFIAILFITKNMSVKWLKNSFWISWTVLLLTILNHSIEIISIPDYFIYFPAGAIIILHFYNMKFCKCADDSCCASKIIE